MQSLAASRTNPTVARPAVPIAMLALVRAKALQLAATTLLVGAIVFGATPTFAAEGPSRSAITQSFFERTSQAVAAWAHPTLTVEATRVVTYRDGIVLDILYRPATWLDQPVVTSLFVPIDEYGRFGDIAVQYDDATFQPFLAMTLMKHLLTQMMAAETESREQREGALIRALQRRVR